MAIPGIRLIVTTDNYLFKASWAILILISFGFGIYNVSYVVNNYYQFDVITNIERVTPDNVTFPAITICAYNTFLKTHYKNGSIIKKELIEYQNYPKILNFLEFIFIYSKKYYLLNAIDRIDSFKTPDYVLDCLRFNGLTNKSIQLFKASSTKDQVAIRIKSNYIVPISENEYINYSFRFSNSDVNIYIHDNHLNSLENIEPISLKINTHNTIGILKESIEIKLPEPYNPCKESSIDEPYHQSSFIGNCIFKEIKDKYNCTFLQSLFSIKGFAECELVRKEYLDFEKEFSPGCLKECPLESCFSEKFTYDVRTIGDLYRTYTIFIFFFRDLSTLNITQIPKIDGFTFINNIGGGLGLFMGVAFPTLVEFIQFIFEIFSITIYH
jgi:hypothetical protein